MTRTEPFARFLIEDDEAAIAELVRSARRIAVLGIKTEAQADQPAYYVPKYLVEAGLDVVPVPVYYPEATQILGRPVLRRLGDVPRPVDIIEVFRRSRDVADHLPALLEAKPRAVWLQSGIRDEVSARKLAEAGILVVQDRCLMVDHQRYAALVGSR